MGKTVQKSISWRPSTYDRLVQATRKHADSFSSMANTVADIGLDVYELAGKDPFCAELVEKAEEAMRTYALEANQERTEPANRARRKNSKRPPRVYPDGYHRYPEPPDELDSEGQEAAE